MTNTTGCHVAGLLQNLALAILYCLFYVVMLASVVIIPFGLPGQFVIAAAALVFTLVVGAETLSWSVVLCLFVVAVLAEIIESLAGFLGAGKARGSLLSCVGALVGGIVGAVLGTLATPVIGTLVGALSGAFIGAYLVEYHITRARGQAARVAKGALVGRILGSIAKIFLAVSMIAAVTVSLIY